MSDNQTPMAPTETSQEIAARAANAVPADDATRDLIARASKGGLGKIDLEAEARAAQVTLATGVPVKATNVAERIQHALASGNLDPAQVQGLIESLQATQQPATAAPPPAQPQAVQTTPAAVARVMQASPTAAPAPTMTPEQLAESARRQIRELTARANAQFARPTGLEAPPEHRARRIGLPLGDQVLEGGTHHVFEAVVPLFANEVPFAELRKLQILPFGADRCVLASLQVDDTELLRGGPTPGTMLTRSDGAPTALLYPGATLRARFVNVGPTPIRLSPSAQIVPLEPRRNGGSP